MTTPERRARRLGAASNAAHGFVYFAPETTTQYNRVGLAEHQHYFASRAAPLGAVAPGVVEAVFYNFAPERVRRAIPSAWAVATPPEVQEARLAAVDAVFGRVGGIGLDRVERDEASDLLTRMISGVGFAGRPLAAANRDVDPPETPDVALWQLITTIREWRGDAHNAVLTAAPVTAVEALVLHAATGKVPTAALRDTRGWSDDQWSAGIAGLAARGLTDTDGAFTEAGRGFRSAIEDHTDVACRHLVDSIGPDDTDRLTALLGQVGAHFSDAGLYRVFNN